MMKHRQTLSFGFLQLSVVTATPLLLVSLFFYIYYIS